MSLAEARILQLKQSLSQLDPETDYYRSRNPNLSEWRDTKKEDEEELFLYVSSKMRDLALEPNATECNYAVRMSADIDNVVGAQLIGGSFALTVNLIDSTNDQLRFSLAPFATIEVIQVTHGRYCGKDLAIEMTRRINEAIFAAQITALTHTIEQTTGLVKSAGVYVSTQMQVTFRPADHSFTFQIVDLNLAPQATNFRLYVEDLQPNTVPALASSDIFGLIGYKNELVLTQGTPAFILGKPYHFLDNSLITPDFSQGLAFSIDAQHRYGIYSSNPADLVGDNIIALHIREFNENDTAMISTKAASAIHIQSALGYFPIPVGKHTDIAQLDFTSTGYPVKKSFRDARRLQMLHIELRRPDGRLYDFRGGEHFLILKLQRRIRKDHSSISTR
jgi:hypothetical protein